MLASMKSKEWIIRVEIAKLHREYFEVDTIEERDKIIKEYMDSAEHITAYNINKIKGITYK